MCDPYIAWTNNKQIQIQIQKYQNIKIPKYRGTENVKKCISLADAYYSYECEVLTLSPQARHLTCPCTGGSTLGSSERHSANSEPSSQRCEFGSIQGALALARHKGLVQSVLLDHTQSPNSLEV
jgi:hypothetical protein